MNKVKKVLFYFLAYILLKKGEIGCQTFHPMSYVSHRLYSFDKASSHELRNDIKEKLNSFVTTNVKDFFKRLAIKNGLVGIQLKNEYEESLVEQIKSLLQQAKNKKMLSAQIKASYEKALRDLQNKGNENNAANERTNKILKHNLEQVQYLNNRVQYLEKKAQHLQNHLKEIKNGQPPNTFICNIKKSGNLHFVSSASGLKHHIDNVRGELDETGFSIYHKNKKKIIYYWNLIDMPVKVIGNIEQCFSFTYKNVNQVFCTKNKIKTASWINALAEGFFCYHFDIKGIVVNQDLDKSQITNERDNPNLLSVTLKPEDNSTRININGEEHELKDNEELEIRKLKREIEDTRKINSSVESSDEKKEKGTVVEEDTVEEDAVEEDTVEEEDIL